MTARPPPKPQPRSLIEKAMTLAAIGMGVGFGTCGLSALVRHDRFSSVFIPIGATIFWASLLLLLFSLIALLIQQLRDRFRK